MNKYIIDKIITTIFPPICGICGKIDNNYLCKKCEIKLRKLSKNIKLISDEELLYIFKYEDIIRELIIKYKFNNKPYMSKTFSTFLLNDKNVFEFIKKYDTIIPVPISKKRKRERGYNQCLLIARETINSINKKENINIELMDNNLIKVKNIIKQSELNEEERKNNIKGAYRLKSKEKINDKKILLIDDIYTTGSTINECKKVLESGNPKSIGALVIAKD